MSVSNFSCVVRISDTYTDRAHTQVERDVSATLRYTGGEGRYEPEASFDGIYAGPASQPRERQGKVTSDWPGQWDEQILDELYRQAFEGSPECVRFVGKLSVDFEVYRTRLLDEVCEFLKAELLKAQVP